jgi:hypothetical protein
MQQPSTKPESPVRSESTQLLADLMVLRPDFTEMWADEAYLWEDNKGNFSPCGIFAVFSHYMAEVLNASKHQSVGDVFEFVEDCMHQSNDMATGVATCFLENLMNRTPGKIDPDSFIPLLGPRSREYCRAWDDFCGVKTKGLW